MRWLFCAALVLVSFLAVPGVGVAAPVFAPPGAPPDDTADSSSQIPQDLRQFVGGTDEFKAGPWFQGECADRGGDVGAYANAVFPHEDRLMYWTSPTVEEKRAILLAGSTNPAESARYDTMIASGQEPPRNLLPRVFPFDNTGFALPSLCADDAQRWGVADWNAWNFTWAPMPDTSSLAGMLQRPGADKVPDNAWTDPCKAGGMYCAHAFFMNCAQAEDQYAERARCGDWNMKVADLFAGTAEWVDQHKNVGDRIGEWVESSPYFAVGLAYVKAFQWVMENGPDNLRNVVAFVKDPQTVIDDWANSSKDSAIDFTTKVLTGIAAAGSFDPTSEGFLRWYTMCTGLGVFVMAFMALMLGARAAFNRGAWRTLAADIMLWGPAGVLMMLFAPFFAGLVTALTTGLALSAADAAGTDIGGMITELKHFSAELTAPGLPGGVLVGMLLFLFMIIGALGIYFGVLMHEYAGAAFACAAAIGFGMWLHPKWRVKALKPVFLWLGLMMAKPLIIILLGMESVVITQNLADPGAAQGGMALLQQLCSVVVGFMVVCFAPWALLKYAPLLPGREDANDFGGGGGSVTASVAGGVATTQMLNSMRTRGPSVQQANTSTTQGTPGQPGGPTWLQNAQQSGPHLTKPPLSAGPTSGNGSGKSAAKTAAKTVGHGTLAAASVGASVAATTTDVSVRMLGRLARRAGDAANNMPGTHS